MVDTLRANVTLNAFRKTLAGGFQVRRHLCLVCSHGVHLWVLAHYTGGGAVMKDPKFNLPLLTVCQPNIVLGSSRTSSTCQFMRVRMENVSTTFQHVSCYYLANQHVQVHLQKNALLHQVFNFTPAQTRPERMSALEKRYSTDSARRQALIPLSTRCYATRNESKIWLV